MYQVLQKGRCVGSGRHDLFFSEIPDDLSLAQEICHCCEVRLACLRLAVEQQAEWGVWGGVIFWDGQPYWRKRGRGRPPRSDQNDRHPLEASWKELEELVASA
jgi:hypothetical protein